MPDIHITREHSLGLAQARELAFRWAETAEAKLDMECTYEEGKTSDLVSFKRPGASGELKVTKDSFVLDARLGLLLGIFKEKIESAIVENLDALLQEKWSREDEPTAAISVRQVAEVLELIRRLKHQNIAVILISHRMPDVFAVCDRVVVMRRGTKVADKEIATSSPEEVTGLITGAIRAA